MTTLHLSGCLVNKYCNWNSSCLLFWYICSLDVSRHSTSAIFQSPLRNILALSATVLCMCGERDYRKIAKLIKNHWPKNLVYYKQQGSPWSGWNWKSLDALARWCHIDKLNWRKTIIIIREISFKVINPSSSEICIYF